MPNTDLAEIVQKLETVYDTDKSKKSRKRKRKKRTLNTKLKSVKRTVKGQPKEVITFHAPVPQTLSDFMMDSNYCKGYGHMRY